MLNMDCRTSDSVPLFCAKLGGLTCQKARVICTTRCFDTALLCTLSMLQKHSIYLTGVKRCPYALSVQGACSGIDLYFSIQSMKRLRARHRLKATCQRLSRSAGRRGDRGCRNMAIGSCGCCRGCCSDLVPTLHVIRRLMLPYAPKPAPAPGMLGVRSARLRLPSALPAPPLSHANCLA